MKKKGDVNNEILKKVFIYLKKNIYKSKIVYGPVIFNMNYAGPREAIHHTYLRELLGFNEFSKDIIISNNIYIGGFLSLSGLIIITLKK